MRPIRFEVIDGKEIFHYDEKELAEFHELGKEHGDVGMYLMWRDGRGNQYGGYGTIENPSKNFQEVYVMRFPAFDGPMTPAEQLCNPVPLKDNLMSVGVIVIDFSKYAGAKK